METIRAGCANEKGTGRNGQMMSGSNGLHDQIQDEGSGCVEEGRWVLFS